MRISMIGTGYVGLVSGSCFADFGHEVVCIDRDVKKIEALQHGEIPIYEPGLEDLVARNVAEGRLSFTSSLANGIAEAEAIFLAVGTPSRRGDGHADLRHLFAAARELAGALRQSAIIVTKSTVPVGTGDELERLLAELIPDAGVTVVSNPEFLREGAAISDFKRPDRIVVGTDDERARDLMRKIYRPLFLNETPILFTSRRTAELIKYAGNAFLATKIGFINEIADLCEALDADVQDVARGIGLDNRIGRKFLNAGPGYGGSCFPKDTRALLQTAESVDTPLRIVEASVNANEARKRSMGRKIIRAMGGNVRGKTIGMLGLTFKPNTDDIRDSPALSIARILLDAGATIRAYDPAGMEQARLVVDGLTLAESPYALAEGADALVLVTEWDAFRALDLDRLHGLMRTRMLIDLRNVFSPAEMARAGFQYECVGKRSSIRSDRSKGEATIAIRQPM